MQRYINRKVAALMVPTPAPAKSYGRVFVEIDSIAYHGCIGAGDLLSNLDLTDVATT